jgi:hypothetical protein
MTDMNGQPIADAETNSYAGNFGRDVNIAEFPDIGNGLLMRNHAYGARDVIDGMSQTILVGERASLLTRVPWSGAINRGICRISHNDNLRTGLNAQEAVLTPQNVNSTTFGKLFEDPVDGQIFSQPLVVTGVNVPGKGVHDLVIVATENDSVYAFDGDNADPVPIWHTSFINPAAGVTAVPGSATNGNVQPEVASGCKRGERRTYQFREVSWISSNAGCTSPTRWR